MPKDDSKDLSKSRQSSSKNKSGSRGAEGGTSKGIDGDGYLSKQMKYFCCCLVLILIVVIVTLVVLMFTYLKNHRTCKLSNNAPIKESEEMQPMTLYHKKSSLTFEGYIEMWDKEYKNLQFFVPVLEHYSFEVENQTYRVMMNLDCVSIVAKQFEPDQLNIWSFYTEIPFKYEEPRSCLLDNIDVQILSKESKCTFDSANGTKETVVRLHVEQFQFLPEGRNLVPRTTIKLKPTLQTTTNKTKPLDW